MSDLSDLAWAAPSLLAYIVVSVLLLLGTYWVLDLVTPGNLTAIIKAGGWNAALLASAQLVGVALIIMFAMLGQPVTWAGIVTASVFAVAGSVAQLAATAVIRAVWLRGEDVAELLASKVSPSGVFMAAASLAVGMVTAVAVH